jgi:hypothetical protein
LNKNHLNKISTEEDIYKNFDVDNQIKLRGRTLFLCPETEKEIFHVAKREKLML